MSIWSIGLHVAVSMKLHHKVESQSYLAIPILCTLVLVSNLPFPHFHLHEYGNFPCIAMIHLVCLITLLDLGVHARYGTLSLGLRSASDCTRVSMP